MDIASEVHFLPIAISAGLAAAAAVALTIVGARRGDGRAVIVGTAFSAMAALLAVHGLTTPGMLVGSNGVIAFTGAATLPVGGAVLALAAVSELRGPRAVRLLLALQAVLLVTIVGLGAVGILVSGLVPSVPEPQSPAAIVTLALAGGFYLMLALRAGRTFLLTRRRADLLVVAGTVVLATALVPALLMDWRELGWWLGHALRAGRDRHGRGARRTRSPPRRAEPAAGRRPRRDRACVRGGCLPRVDGTGAARPLGREGRLHGRTHAPGGAALGGGGRETRPGAGTTARPGHRGPAARHRQAVCAGRDPAEAGRADRRGVRRDPPPPRARPRPRAPARLSPAGVPPRARPPRAPRRRRLPARAARGRARPRDAHPDRVRRARRAALHPRVPRGVDARQRARVCCTTRAERPSIRAACRPSSTCCGQSSPWTCSLPPEVLRRPAPSGLRRSFET